MVKNKVMQLNLELITVTYFILQLEEWKMANGMAMLKLTARTIPCLEAYIKMDKNKEFAILKMLIILMK